MYSDTRVKGLAFIHEKGIAHRVSPFISTTISPDISQDAFHDNFLVQWHPESLTRKEISPSRPRVYLTDFEAAVEFQSQCSLEERLCTGLPVADSFPIGNYCRPHAPEFVSGKPYNPFKLDVWQVGVSFLKLQFEVRDSFSCIYMYSLLFAI
jgi:serine/threonine protein kinase